MDLEKLECLYLKWQDYKTGKKYFLGTLYRDKDHNKYYFKLSPEDIEKAVAEGFSTATLPFSDYNKIYESSGLPALFRTRVPRKERMSKETQELFKEEFNMKEYDEFEYLRITHGETITDYFIVDEEK